MSLVAVTVLDHCNHCHQQLYLHLLRKVCSYYETHTQTVVYSAAQARMPVCGESLREINAVVFHLHTGYFPCIPGTRRPLAPMAHHLFPLLVDVHALF